MPHCIVEHSETLNGGLLIPLVFAGALQLKLFESDGSDIKVRAISYPDFCVGTERSDFVHVVLKVLPGRMPEQKLMLSQAVLAQLQTVALPGCSLTVEIVDIDGASYSKFVS